LAGQVTRVESSADDGSDEIRVPETTASVSANWLANEDGLKIGAALDYVGAQDDFNFGTFPSTRVTLDSYAMASVTAEIPVSERLAITLRGDNLFDEEVTDVFGYYGPGAGAYIGLRLR
jgi:vitamin B12 transporter